MRVTMLTGKLHRVRITQCELEYEGSCAIDMDLMEAAGIREYQQVAIYNIANGERFTTYAIRGARGSGVISLNGAAARKGTVGDRVIIAVYGDFDEAELCGYAPKLVYVDEGNRITARGDRIAAQATLAVG